MIDFLIDKHSHLPAHVQIQEQIKLALLLGRLRPGDTLPSIRDVEKQIMISRTLVRKAYLGLQRSGILSLQHGKGVLVEKHVRYSDHTRMTDRCEQLSKTVLAKARRLGIGPSAFARYLFQQARLNEKAIPFVIYVDATKAIAAERAAMISSHWHVNVPGMSYNDIKSMVKNRANGVRAVLTNYFRLEQVQKLFGNRHVDVIPLSLRFSAAMKNEFRHIPAGCEVTLVLEDSDFPTLSLILDSYRKQQLVGSSVKLSSLRLSQIRDLRRLVQSKRFAKMIFSNRVWDKLPDNIRKHPRVTHPKMEIDPSSLENARIRAGVIL